jgi:hypothetical protein
MVCEASHKLRSTQMHASADDQVGSQFVRGCLGHVTTLSNMRLLLWRKMHLPSLGLFKNFGHYFCLESHSAPIICELFESRHAANVSYIMSRDAACNGRSNTF